MTSNQTIGKYTLSDELGRGGFGVVYRAEDPYLGRTVALKVLHPYHSDPAFLARFEREARTAAQFNHPHIVTVYEVGEDQGRHYLAMAYLEGHTLAERLAQGPLPLDQALAILGHLAQALDTIHRRNLTHRDVKPGNLMLTPGGRAVLLDFGLVRAADGTQLTMTAATLGTAAYMAPEQADPDRWGAVTPRTDGYALGVIAYELLAGRRPFGGDNPLQLLYQHSHTPPPDPLEIRPELPPGLGVPLLKALAKPPAERYSSAGEFVRALQAAWQADRQQAHLSPLYHQLLAAVKEADWVEVLDLGGQIRAVTPDYRDVPALLHQAKQALRRSPGPSPTPSPQPKKTTPQPAGDTMVWEKDGKVMVRVPAGEFLYGDKKEQKTLPEFWIDQTPVTNAEYARFVADTNHKPPSHWSGKKPDEKIAAHPITNVSWRDAEAYAQWAGKRLPTEEEWEKAARGPDGRKYPWGDEPPTKERCNFGGNVGGTTPVGHYSPQGDSPYGCEDMSGNVWEWTASDYDQSRKVLRGGSWYINGELVRAASRDGFSLDERGLVGFRCVASPGQ